MTGKTCVCGLHAVTTLLSVRPGSVHEINVADSRRDSRCQRIIELASAAGIPVHSMPRAELDDMQPGMRHQGVIARVSLSGEGLREAELQPFLDNLDATPFLLVLDGVQDPHNLGACLRTADAAGVHAVIVPRDRAAHITPTVRKVASGAAETVPLFSVTNLARCLRSLKAAGIWLYAASDAADTAIYDMSLQGPIALVLGGEGKGLRRLTRDLCDYQLAIPMAGQVESLNVSVAAGVLLYEAVRQRRQAT
ncbi:MAG: 23S rRNA (guanosine(2251)-2'-O)-methyltransferase RlmB [Pseudomonadota bacterium]